MKKILALCLLGVGTAFGNIDTELLEVTPAESRCEGEICSYTYSARLHSRTMLVNGNFFTIFDFWGLDAIYDASDPSTTISAPDGWDIIVGTTGMTPGNVQVPGDSPDVLNVTFQWTGGNVAANSELGLFSILSVNGPSTVFEPYASRSTSVANGTNADSISRIAVPNPDEMPGGDPPEVPEPMSMVLLSGGLLAVSLLPKRFRKN